MRPLGALLLILLSFLYITNEFWLDRFILFGMNSERLIGVAMLVLIAFAMGYVLNDR